MSPSASSRRNLGAYCFIAPNALGFLAFLALPLAVSLCLAFTNWRMLDPPRGLGGQ